MSTMAVGAPMELLLVEDGLTDACLAIAALKKGEIRHRLTLIRDGMEAMEFLHRVGKFARAPRPDLILLDLGLPKKDGREVLADIRANDSLKTIPVVVLTSSDDYGDQLDSESLGVEGYITKPVDLTKFLVVIKRLQRFWREDLVLPAL